MSREFILSATALSNFVTCPYKFYLSRKYTMKKVPPYFRDGIAAHAIMEGKEVKDATETAKKYATILQQLVDNWGMTPIETELSEYFEIEGVKVSRRIDAVMDFKGRMVFVDYKTGLSQWKTDTMRGVEFSPKAMGFQASLYTYPNPDSPYKDVKSIFFLIASGQTLGFETSIEEEMNVRQAVKLFDYSRRNKLFPKYRGGNCLGENGGYRCQFYDLCYKNNDSDLKPVRYSI